MIICSFSFVEDGLTPLTLVRGAAVYLALSPYVVCRYLLVPLGLFRLTYLWSGLAPSNLLHGDPRGSRLLLGALALRRQRRPRVADVEWLDRRMPYHHFRGASVVALALLDEARGNRTGCRALMRSVAGLVEPLCPYLASAQAERWLVEDALRRSAWHELASVDAAPVLGTTRFYGVAARRILGAEAVPSFSGLVLRWLGSGSWVRTFDVLCRARDGPRKAVAAATPGDPGALIVAMSASEQDETTLLAILRGWDRLLTTRDWDQYWCNRAHALSADWGAVRDELVDRFRWRILDLLQDVAVSPSALSALNGPFSDSVYRACRERLYEDLAKRLGQLNRLIQERDAPPDEIWRSFAWIVDVCEQLRYLGQEHELRMAVSEVRETASATGCAIFNDRGLRSPAKAMFTWLARLTEDVGLEDERATDRLNARVALEADHPSGFCYPVRMTLAILWAVAFAWPSLLLLPDGVQDARVCIALDSMGKGTRAVVTDTKVMRKEKGSIYSVSYRFPDPRGQAGEGEDRFIRQENVRVDQDTFQQLKRTRDLEVLYSPEDPQLNIPGSQLQSTAVRAVFEIGMATVILVGSTVLAAGRLKMLRSQQKEAERFGRGC